MTRQPAARVGGGAGNRTRVQKADRAAVYERSLRSLSRPELIPQTGPLRSQPTDKSPPKAAGAPPEQAGLVHARVRSRRREAAGRLLHQSSFDAGLTEIRQRARSCSCCSRLLFCRFLRGQRRLGSQTALQSSLSRPFAPTRRWKPAGPPVRARPAKDIIPHGPPRPTLPMSMTRLCGKGFRPRQPRRTSGGHTGRKASRRAQVLPAGTDTLYG